VAHAFHAFASMQPDLTLFLTGNFTAVIFSRAPLEIPFPGVALTFFLKTATVTPLQTCRRLNLLVQDPRNS
jgi:hypothetical protein